MTKLELRALLFARRLPASGETDVQERIADRLTAAGVTFEREKRLPGDSGRIDFALTLEGRRIGLELKVKSGGGNTARQLLKYALSDEFDELVLLTTKAFRLPVSSFTSGQREIPVEIWQAPI